MVEIGRGSRASLDLRITADSPVPKGEGPGAPMPGGKGASRLICSWVRGWGKVR